MDDRTRSNLIKQLAKESGMLDPYDSKYGKSYYDKSTGTFYCEGIVIPKNRVEHALNYFQKQMYIYRDMANRDNTMLETYCNYAVAFNAISLLNETVQKKIVEEDKGNE